MKKIAVYMILLAVAIVIALFATARMSRGGQAPGLVDGRLTPCPGEPHCVCSEYPDAAEHFVEPLDITSADAENPGARLRGAIVELGGAVRSERADYISATFTSSLFGFVDDLEIRIDRQAAKIHFRSSSRIGYSDMGVNRKRVEALKQQFLQSAAAS
ncbi:MAG TPA: DUF1499 domain-containing protein [Gammaproteobacteria bacterium]|nr:DUF1499 domain-containing protein [Gammaproteobacteria bacterium]